jgi:hypothetical protein
MSLPVYRGYHLYTVEPNWTGEGDFDLDRLSSEVGISIGRRGARARGGPARLTIPFAWLLIGRTAFLDFHEFWLARRGRMAPVWMPSWAQDLPLAADVGPTDSDITIHAIDYTARHFPRESRRHLAFNQGGNAMVVRRVTAAVDNGDGTETLTLESSTGASWSAPHSLVSFCLLVRAVSDGVTLVWHNHELAAAAMDFVEVPLEVAA